MFKKLKFERIIPFYIRSVMPQLLRLYFQEQNYIFQVLTEKPSLQSSLEIFFNGKTYIYRSHNHRWVFQNLEQEAVNEALFEAIGKALALRFRISTGIENKI